MGYILDFAKKKGVKSIVMRNIKEKDEYDSTEKETRIKIYKKMGKRFKVLTVYDQKSNNIVYKI